MPLQQRLEENPVIAAVLEGEKLRDAIESPCQIIFLLSGNICTVEETVEQVRNSGKEIYLHLDLLDGFGRDRYAVRYLRDRISPSGIITTKTSLVKIAKDLQVPVIQRVFLIDNLSLQTGIQTIRQMEPEAVEVMPGVMPGVTRKICASVPVPVICGGLINEKEDMISGLGAGAVGVSTSNIRLWNL